MQLSILLMLFEILFWLKVQNHYLSFIFPLIPEDMADKDLEAVWEYRMLKHEMSNLKKETKDIQFKRP